jgi:two-component system LytT family response regulator
VAPRPSIIFCTAYDEYAVDAFELHAVDYLLKPVNRTRLEHSIQRVRPGNDSVPQIDSAIDSATAAAGAYPSRFLGKRKMRFFVVPGADVLTFESDGGQTKLRTGQHHFWMQPTLTDLEQRLDPKGYVRISRAAIIRLDQIREVVPQPGGYGEVKLSDGSTLEVSRRRFKELMQRLE